MNTTTFVDWSALKTYALQQLGVPYLFGAKPGFDEVYPRAFDCSGYVRWVYGQIGIELPEGSQDQYDLTISLGNALPQLGDVGFFLANGVTHHVGMLLTELEVIEARGYEPALEAEGIKTNQVIIRPRTNWELWREFSGWRRFKALCPR